MNNWISCMTLACSVAVGQTAAAEQLGDRAYGHSWLQDQRSPAHGVASQAHGQDRIVTGGYINDRHDQRQRRRLKHRQNRHTQHSYCGHERGHYRRQHRHAHHDDGRRCSAYDRSGRHDRHCYHRPARRINRVIRAY